MTGFIRYLIKKCGLEKCVLIFSRGHRYSYWMHPFIPLHTQYTKGSIRRCKRNNISYELDISDLMDWYIYFGFFEDEKAHFFRLIKNGDVILDIGANLGQFSFVSAMRAGKSGKVFAFEPDEFNFSKLLTNFKLNEKLSIKLINKAVGDKISKGKMKINDIRNSGGHQVIYDTKGELDILKLDDFADLELLTRIDVIKIDTEGAELKILNGANAIIQKNHPILYIEIDGENLLLNQHAPIDIFNFLIAYNYKIYKAKSMKEIVLSENFDNCHFDIIALPLSPTKKFQH